MKKKLLFLLFSVFNLCVINAQNLQGRVSYKFVMNTYFDKEKSMSPKIEIRDLHFNNDVSVFNNFAFADTAIFDVQVAGMTNKTKAKKIFIKKTNSSGKIFFQNRDMIASYVEENISDIDWQLHEESKQLGSFLCKKATCKFRGREWTVWYAPQIPVNHGPWKLQGLPGLILEAYDKLNEVQFLYLAMEIPFDVADFVILQKEGKEFSFEEYKENPATYFHRAAEKELSEQLKSQVKISYNPNAAPIELDFD